MKLLFSKIFLLIVILISVCGCGSVEESNKKSTQDVKQRASFDFNCPIEKIKVSLLKTHPAPFNAQGLFQQLGASGCDKRAVYVHTCGDDSCQWILNSSNSSVK